MRQDYEERVYAGWYGKLIGIRHGSNIEGWTYERILETYGEIENYLFQFKNFAADDDSNGPLFFVRSLTDHAKTDDITAKEMGDTLLNYAPFEHGFFWWGGYGRSTEHTAYTNLSQGIEAPLSGSVDLNGPAVAEQIGGQIFIDVWGLINPGNPQRAAKYARKMASVTHGGNGIYGGMFVAACVAAAFEKRKIDEVIDEGLATIPANCEYARVVREVRSYHELHPEDWHKCFAFVKAHFGYDKYPGNCHIIPNTAAIILSLLYGEGDFSRSINICNMCGWDTDCNVANVGCIVGTMVGLDGIDYTRWREPISDLLICSSTLGSMNIRDVANDALYLAALGYLVDGRKPPLPLTPHMSGHAQRYRFELPGSTHAFRTEGPAAKLMNAKIEGRLPRAMRALVHGDWGPLRIYQQTYYLPEDFNDCRYDPSFSPTAYPGQRLYAELCAESTALKARLFAMDLSTGKYHRSRAVSIAKGAWKELTYDIPEIRNGCLYKVGIEVEAEADMPYSMLVGGFAISGTPTIHMNFAGIPMDAWQSGRRNVRQCSRWKGHWHTDDGRLHGSCADRGELYTGPMTMGDVRVTADLSPHIGERHGVLFRVQGAVRSYGVYLAEGDRLVLGKRENIGPMTELASMAFPWKAGSTYKLAIEARGNAFTVFCGGKEMFTAKDKGTPYAHGCVGLAVENGSHCDFASLRVEPLEAEGK